MRSGPAAVAIVGSGELARAHARVVVAHPDLRLVALVDADTRSGVALGDLIVTRFEGERPPLFADLADALAAFDVDIVAVAEADEHATTVAGAARAVVVGGVEPDGGTGSWFPFDPGSGGDEDVAFTSHLRQYERVLAMIEFGSHVEPTEVSA